MRHLNYFLALVPAGSFALLMVLGPILTIPTVLVVHAMGLQLDSETMKLVGYSTVAIVWSVALIFFWFRNRGLAPKFARAGRASRLLCGQLCLIAGHAIALCILLMKALGDLMILPVLAVLFFYSAGIILIEMSRDRQVRTQH